jgi:hypothetical protein
MSAKLLERMAAVACVGVTRTSGQPASEPARRPGMVAPPAVTP